MSYIPSYKITPKILSLVSEISEAIGGVNVVAVERSPQLRKQNQIKMILGTLAIEGNTLGVEQVSAILEGKPVGRSQREIAEVCGVMRAYEMLENYKPYQINDLLDSHRQMMKEVLPEAGFFRSGNVGVHASGKVIHVAPAAGRVEFLMQGLLDWVGKADVHALICSCVFHYEFEFIHPFSDGNSRIGSLWQALILGQWRSLFYSLPIENIIKDKQQDYNALRVADKQAKSTLFIEFMLNIILDSINNTDQVNGQVSVQASVQVKKLLSVMGNDYLSTVQIMEKVGLSHRDTFRKNYLLPALKQGLIKMSHPETRNSPKQKYKRKNNDDH